MPRFNSEALIFRPDVLGHRIVTYEFYLSLAFPLTHVQIILPVFHLQVAVKLV
jgi:hypothetical protein